MRRTIISLLVLAALLGAAPSPAHAETGAVPDAAEGEYPDILRLRIDNGTDTLSVRIAYTALPTGEFGGEEVHFGQAVDKAHYAVGAHWNYMTEKWVAGVWRVTASGELNDLPCPGLTRFRNYDTDVSRYSVPRSCIPNAADSLRFWAIACTAGCDEVARSRLFARG